MASMKAGAELPGWAMPLAIAVGVIVLILVGWRAFFGPSPTAPGPTVKVHPGMFDFRKEAASGTLTQRSGNQSASPH